MLKRPLAIVIIVVLAVAAVAAIAFSAGFVSSSHPSSTAGGISINKARSGLVESNPINSYETQQQLQTNSSYWAFGGTTNSSAYYSFYESADQLHIGVAAPNSGEWSGFYAVTPATNASLVHATLTASTGQISGYYDTGLYVQSSNELVDYVTCIAITTPSGTTWGVVHGYGDSPQNVTIVPLWVDTSPNQPLTQDCTIVATDSSIDVYLSHNEVFSSNSSALNMPEPYNFFVEEESEYAGTILYGSYQNFYIALNDTVTVTDAPSNAVEVALVNQSGAVYASAPVVKGSATLNVGQYDYPLNGYVRAYSSSSISNSTQIATTSLEAVYGGDIYTFGSPPPSTVTLTVQAQDETGHDLSGLYVTISQGRQAVLNGSTPWNFQLDTGQSYTVTAYDYGSYVFSHWSDGSTVRTITISLEQSATLVAVYSDSKSPPPAGETAVSVSANDTGGAPITGLSVTVWHEGVLVGVSYTPAIFYLTTGSSYLILPSNYGGYTFTSWSNGSDNSYYSLTPEGQFVSLTAVYQGS